MADQLWLMKRIQEEEEEEEVKTSDIIAE